MKTMFGKRVPNCVKNEDMSQPNFDFEWGEAERYPFLAKLGKEGWIELANTGKTVIVNKDNVNQIGNTGADGGETFDDLDPDKVGRFKSAIAKGTVEMPIIIKMPNGQLELVAGNTRLIGLINKEGKAKVWYIDASKLNERNLNPAVADYVKGKNTKLIKVRVADLDDEAIDDRFGRVIDPDPDVGVDLDEPILVDKDGKTILDGFHRVYQAKRVGRKVIPAEIIDENFADGLPQEVEQFVSELVPTDVGVDTVGDYVVHFEGFTDQCNDGYDDDSIQDVYAEVYQDFDDRQGQKALIRGVAYDDLCVDCNPVLYSVYKKIDENFADGKKKGKSRPGRVKRAGASCKGSVSSLRAKAKKYSGERGKMYHWCANMKGGRNK